MDKKDIRIIQTMIDQHGSRNVLRAFIKALSDSTDQLSDMGFKERIPLRITLLDLLWEVDQKLDE